MKRIRFALALAGVLVSLPLFAPAAAAAPPPDPEPGFTPMIIDGQLATNAPWAARAYSLVSVGYMDAYVASQDSKFAYWVARPNMFDPSITTLFPNPNHPSYPSNAAIFNGTVTAILAHLFPRDAALFKGLGDQAGESRIWAGIHFRSDVEGGRVVAQNVANVVIARLS